MQINESEKQELRTKLNEILNNQSQLQHDIRNLEAQITQLTEQKAPTSAAPIERHSKKIFRHTNNETRTVTPQQKKENHSKFSWAKTGFNTNLEKFIGENLISKIGIAVLIIGVGIGAKYAIDNNLISPLVRIVLGYLVGFVLTFFAINLKKKFHNFSAVLFGGAMAIHYFISYAAYTYYSLIPHSLTFVLMVLITVLTVTLALYYNRQVIAHLGLAGAYIVPFLLKDPNSNVLVLLSYMVIINSGILFISTKKRWKPLNYVAFISTWIIFISWFSSKAYDNQLTTSLTFASLFFVIFYLVFLSYKLILKEKLRLDDIIFLLLNTAMYFTVGNIALSVAEYNTEFSGLFTLINAIIHGGTAYLVYCTSLNNKKLFYWTTGLVITFITIAIPVQFKDYLVAVLWSVETAVIFWFGRSKKIKIYEMISYVLVILLLLITAINMGSTSYHFHLKEITKFVIPVLNFQFWASLVAIFALAYISWFQKKTNSKPSSTTSQTYIFDTLVPFFFIAATFFLFYTEINLHWNNIQINTSFEQNSNGVWIKQFDDLNADVFNFKKIWLLNYSLLFAAVLGFINFNWFKKLNLNALILVFSFILIIVFFASTLDTFAHLRTNYLSPSENPNFDTSLFHILIRYITYLFFAVLLYSLFRFVLPIFTAPVYKPVLEVILSIIIIWICSSELINILSLTGSSEVYKLALSILWGIFSFLLIAHGIWKKKNHLRITAISLFGVTLIKLFLYDLTHLSTVQKTIVFVSLGALLLIVSFMYNKYRDVIFENE